MSKPLKRAEWPARQTIEQLKEYCPDVRDELFWSLYEKWKTETLIPPDRLHASYSALSATLNNGVPGAIVECGVFRGGSFCFFLDVVQTLVGPTREFWAYDTFEGFPEEVDEVLQGGATFRRDDWHTDNFLKFFERNVSRTGYPLDKVHIVKGSVLDTIPAHGPSEIAFLHLDTDYYEATKHELEHLYDRVPKGAAVAIDDYGYFEGSRRAVDEFFAVRPKKPIMVRADHVGRLLLKPE